MDAAAVSGLETAKAAVLVQSEEVDPTLPKVRGYDFNEPFDFDKFIGSYLTTGFQASNLGQAIETIKSMLAWRLSDEEVKETDEVQEPEARARVRCTVFLGFTSNLISSGLREVLRYLVQHRMVDCIVTTAGGVEEDLIKCMAPTLMGDFSLAGAALRAKGLNRIGNMLVPNRNYCLFEDWITPVLAAMLEEQERDGVVWSPARITERLGREIDHEDSLLYWAARNGVPVFCPALTDGSIGDMVYFSSYKAEAKLRIDIAQDIVRLNRMAVTAPKTGMVILGGGLVKHHICNANLMRNGADFSVFVNTGQEFDGSDSGARPDEAVSWGKIRIGAKAVKVYAEATVVFPLIVAAAFAPAQRARAAEAEAEAQA